MPLKVLKNRMMTHLKMTCLRVKRAVGGAKNLLKLIAKTWCDHIRDLQGSGTDADVRPIQRPTDNLAGAEERAGMDVSRLLKSVGVPLAGVFLEPLPTSVNEGVFSGRLALRRKGAGMHASQFLPGGAVHKMALKWYKGVRVREGILGLVFSYSIPPVGDFQGKLDAVWAVRYDTDSWGRPETMHEARRVYPA